MVDRLRRASLHFVVPGRLETPTGGYVYDRHIIAGLRARGWSVDVHALDDSFPEPTPAALERAAAVLSAAPDGSCVLVDGLAFGAMAELAEREAARLRLVALVHLPLGADVTREASERARLGALEARALRAAALIVVTGEGTLGLLDRYGLDRRTTIVVEPGTERQAIGARVPRVPVVLLAVATLHPGKGHDTLLHALASLVHLEWRLVCAGSRTRHPDWAAAIDDSIARLGLGERVSLVGELDEDALGRCYDSADVFVLPTLQETYGMAVAEALAHGLPVVATRTGAIPAMVGTDAGILVEPGDSAALGAALERIIGDAPLRQHLGAGARRAARELPSWDDASDRLARALARLHDHG